MNSQVTLYRTYKGISIYKFVSNNHPVHYGIKKDPNSNRFDIFFTFDDVIKEIDQIFIKKQKQKQYEEYEKSSEAKKRFETEERLQSLHKLHLETLENTLNSLKRKFASGIYSVSLYYRDKSIQKQIVIQHLKGKKYLVKDSRKKEREMYESELTSFLLNKIKNYSIGRWY